MTVRFGNHRLGFYSETIIILLELIFCSLYHKSVYTLVLSGAIGSNNLVF